MSRRLRIPLFVAAGVALSLIAAVAVVIWRVAPHTRYASGFQVAAYERIHIGDRLDQVVATLGQPLSKREESQRERWCYGAAPSPPKTKPGLISTQVAFDLSGPSCAVFDAAGNVVSISGDVTRLKDVVGKDHEAVRRQFGEPTDTEPAANSTVFYYSEPAWPHASFVMVWIVFDGSGRVTRKINEALMD